MQHQFDEEKFRELLLYIAAQCESDMYFGATKLNKQLFYIDFLAALRWGQPVTGIDYMAVEHGPVPRYLLPIRAAMVDEGELMVREGPYGQQRIVALREADITLFGEGEFALVNEVLEALRDSTAGQVSDLSHRFLGWQAAMAEGQATGRHISIPYGTVHVTNLEPTEELISRTRALAEQYEWAV
jgi:hypothetical protein